MLPKALLEMKYIYFIFYLVSIALFIISFSAHLPPSLSYTHTQCVSCATLFGYLHFLNYIIHPCTQLFTQFQPLSIIQYILLLQLATMGQGKLGLSGALPTVQMAGTKYLEQRPKDILDNNGEYTSVPMLMGAVKHEGVFVAQCKCFT